MNECANETTPHNDAVFTSGNAEVQGNKDVSFFFFFFFTRNATRTAGGQQMEAGLDSEPAVGISWPYFQGSSLYIETN